jgi:hypothetical protein
MRQVELHAPHQFLLRQAGEAAWEQLQDQEGQWVIRRMRVCRR